jgi:hypothetical protein
MSRPSLRVWDLTAGVIPLGKKHFKLQIHHLGALVDFVGQGNALQSHDNVPEHIRYLPKNSSD